VILFSITDAGEAEEVVLAALAMFFFVFLLHAFFYTGTLNLNFNFSRKLSEFIHTAQNQSRIFKPFDISRRKGIESMKRGC